MMPPALMNASTGFVVSKSFGDLHKKSWKLTDSQVILQWLNCIKTALKMWVRNRVVEITRLVDPSFWYYVNSENMVADLGTRNGAKIEYVGTNSPWINGLPWMRGKEVEFPVRTIEKIRLSGQERGEANMDRVGAELENTDPCGCKTCAQRSRGKV